MDPIKYVEKLNNYNKITPKKIHKTNKTLLSLLLCLIIIPSIGVLLNFQASYGMSGIRYLILFILLFPGILILEALRENNKPNNQHNLI